MDSTRAYPLYWPEGWPRAKSQKQARFDDRSVYMARRFLQDEVRRFGGNDLIISSNLELKLDGTPRSNQRQPLDRGVAIYFKRKGEEKALACDVYSTVEDNLWALCRTMEALRQIERDGSPELINRAFKGFAALPDPSAREWWEVLNVSRTANNAEIRTAYLQLAKKYHPDTGDNGRSWMELLISRDMNHDFKELRGRDLACWCPLNHPCHADVLLELANMEVRDEE